MHGGDPAVTATSRNQSRVAAEGELAAAVRAGLASRPKRLPSRLFYDAVGSALFQRIMELPEYYLTRSEHEILTREGPRVARRLSPGPCDVVDLGAGDGRKTLILLRALTALGVETRYVPVDISAAALDDLAGRMYAALPTLDVRGLLADWTDGLARASESAPERRRLVLFLGSNIGNVTPTEAATLLCRLAHATRPGDLLLLGVDLRKDPRVLLPAYDDAEGVTARFNLNLLARINQELGGTFDLDTFQHHALWNPVSGAMESYLLSRAEQTVTIRALSLEVPFYAWEPIHTEVSQKYDIHEVEHMLTTAGFEVEDLLFDERGWFLDALARRV